VSFFIVTGYEAINIVNSTLHGGYPLSGLCREALTQLIANKTDPNVLACEYTL